MPSLIRLSERCYATVCWIRYSQELRNDDTAPQGDTDRLERILDRLNAANEIKDMNYPGSNLHKLTGDKKDQYAVKVSGNWRVFFKFIDGDAYVVDYEDYH